MGVLPINDDTSPAMASLGAASGAATALMGATIRRVVGWPIATGLNSGWLPLCVCEIGVPSRSITSLFCMPQQHSSRTICNVEPNGVHGMANALVVGATMAIACRCAVGVAFERAVFGLLYLG